MKKYCWNHKLRPAPFFVLPTHVCYWIWIQQDSAIFILPQPDFSIYVNALTSKRGRDSCGDVVKTCSAKEGSRKKSDWRNWNKFEQQTIKKKKKTAEGRGAADLSKMRNSLLSFSNICGEVPRNWILRNHIQRYDRSHFNEKRTFNVRWDKGILEYI